VNFKLDENLDPRIGLVFAEGGHDVETAVSEGMSGSSDDELYNVCCRERRTLITLDLDFANPLRFPPEGTAGIIVLRPPVPSLPLIRTTIGGALAHIKSGQVDGRLWIVEPGRIRVHDSRSPYDEAGEEASR
jgi:hypothetical protein